MTDNLFDTCSTVDECLVLMGKIHKIFAKKIKLLERPKKETKNTRLKKYKPTGSKCGANTAKGKPCDRKAYVELQGRCPCHSGASDRALDVRDHPCHVDFMTKFPEVGVDDLECDIKMRLIVVDRLTKDYARWNEAMGPGEVRWVKMIPTKEDGFNWKSTSFSLVGVEPSEKLIENGEVFTIKFSKHRTEVDDEGLENIIPLDGRLDVVCR